MIDDFLKSYAQELKHKLTEFPNIVVGTEENRLSITYSPAVMRSREQVIVLKEGDNYNLEYSALFESAFGTLLAPETQVMTANSKLLKKFRNVAEVKKKRGDVEVYYGKTGGIYSEYLSFRGNTNREGVSYAINFFADAFKAKQKSVQRG